MEDGTTLMQADGSVELRSCAERIVGRVDAWLEKNGAFVPLDTARRRQHARNWRQYVRALLGALTPVPLPDAQNLVFFEGLRDKVYHRFFGKNEIVIIGSHAERQYAQANGFGFAWSFPIEGAVRLALTRQVHSFLVHQLRSWANRLRRYETVRIFLYEDTQPLGAFFAHVAALAGDTVKVVCIQHGYFPKPLNDLPLDGSASEINFVWDQPQADLIGCPPHKAFVIGPPVSATAKATRFPGVVLVGTGTSHDGTGDYERTLAWYTSLVALLSRDLQGRVWYRPHPNELVNRENADRLQELFPMLDLLPLSERLSGEVSVFVGSLSSVLFEAGYAGHQVVRVGLREDAIPMFRRNAEFSASQLHEAAKWIEAACSGGEMVSPTPNPRPTMDFPAASRQVLSTVR